MIVRRRVILNHSYSIIACRRQKHIRRTTGADNRAFLVKLLTLPGSIRLGAELQHRRNSSTVSGSQ